MNEHALSHTDI